MAETRVSDGSVNSPIVAEATETTPLCSDEQSGSKETSCPTASDSSNKTRKRLTIAAFALLYFTTAASYSVIAPFFPNEANKKGASSDIVGFIFGCFALVIFVFSPIMGKLLPTVGVRFMLFSGMFFVGVAEALFGLLNKMPDGTVFIVYSFVLRVFDGIGGAACMTAAVAYLAQCFPDNVGSVMGGLELFNGLGLTMGPLLGGVLYEYGGFGLPFFFLAGLILLAIPPVACLLPSGNHASRDTSDEGATTDASIIKLLKIPTFVIVVATITFGGMAIGIIEPTLAPHLKNEFKINSGTKVGVMFFLLAATYGIFAPIFGWVADKTNPRCVMMLGNLVCATGFFLLGPAPVSFLPKSLWLVYVSLPIIGISLGPCFVPAIAEMEKIAKARGFPDNLATHGIISGIFGSAFSVGSFVGPTLSGVFTKYLHFSWTCTGFGLMLLLQALLLGLTLFGGPKDTKNSKKTEINSTESDSGPRYENPKTIQA